MRYKGQHGLVKVGTDIVGQTRSWEVTTDVPIQDATVQGEAWQTHEAFAPGWTGTITAFWDPADTGQLALEAGLEVTLELYPSGQASGDTYYSGTATITSTGRVSPFDNLVEQTFGFTGKGALDTQAVAP